MANVREYRDAFQGHGFTGPINFDDLIQVKWLISLFAFVITHCSLYLSLFCSSLY
jgi:hypothetical protein